MASFVTNVFFHISSNFWLGPVSGKSINTTGKKHLKITNYDKLKSERLKTIKEITLPAF